MDFIDLLLIASFKCLLKMQNHFISHFIENYLYYYFFIIIIIETN